jgi:hypothetical protein
MNILEVRKQCFQCFSQVKILIVTLFTTVKSRKYYVILCYIIQNEICKHLVKEASGGEVVTGFPVSSSQS